MGLAAAHGGPFHSVPAAPSCSHDLPNLHRLQPSPAGGAHTACAAPPAGGAPVRGEAGGRGCSWAQAQRLEAGCREAVSMAARQRDVRIGDQAAQEARRLAVVCYCAAPVAAGHRLHRAAAKPTRPTSPHPAGSWRGAADRAGAWGAHRLQLVKLDEVNRAPRGCSWAPAPPCGAQRSGWAARTAGACSAGPT